MMQRADCVGDRLFVDEFFRISGIARRFNVYDLWNPADFGELLSYLSREIFRFRDPPPASVSISLDRERSCVNVRVTGARDSPILGRLETL